jgi:hypothetical protein
VRSAEPRRASEDGAWRLRAIEPAWQITVVAPAEGPLLERAGIGAVMLPYPTALAAIGEPATAGAPRLARLRTAFQLVSTAAVLWPYLRHLRGDLRRPLPGGLCRRVI